MTDLDTLRRALQTQQHHDWDGPRTPDLGNIMVRGRRLRLRRRLTAVGGAVCAAAIVFGVVSGIGQLARPSPVPVQRPADSARSTHPPSPRPAHVSTPVPAPSPSGSPAAPPSARPGRSDPTPVPSQGTGAGSVTPPSKAAGLVPVVASGKATGSTPVPAHTQSGLTMAKMPHDQHPYTAPRYDKFLSGRSGK